MGDPSDGEALEDPMHAHGPENAASRPQARGGGPDLDTASREIVRASRALKAVFRPEKLNVAALGNQVPQLHIHVIARFNDDPAWPGPIWGVVPPRDYEATALEARFTQLREAFSNDPAV
jgi:hypothetical protein